MAWLTDEVVRHVTVDGSAAWASGSDQTLRGEPGVVAGGLRCEVEVSARFEARTDYRC
jgi:hypothetical protein